MRIPVARIRVGKRFRKEMGDIGALAAEFAGLDMLQPIVVRPDARSHVYGYELACGARRLAAAKLNGKTHIEATVRHLTDAEMLRAEGSENIHRKSFTLQALEPHERAAAKERQGTRTDKHPGNLPTSAKGRAADKIAKVTGMSRRTLERAEAIVDAAEAEPGSYGKFLAIMDRTGHVNGVHKLLKRQKQAEAIEAEPPPLPGRGPYRVIVVDLPWPDGARQDDPSCRGAAPYPTMSIKQMCGINIAALAHPDSILWLWTTNHHMRDAYTIVDAWGFEAKSILTWAKDRMGLGEWLRGQTEHCIMAVRGKPVVTLKNQTTLLSAPLRAHSQKPVEFYDLVESLCPAPRYADLFSRYRHSEKWDCHGDEAPKAEAAE
jgi:N6-adenosine-specific RNA methylase IME4